MMKRYFLLAILFVAVRIMAMADGVYRDSSTTDLKTFFTKANATYVIRYAHTTSDSVVLPKDATLDFQGGSINARKLRFSSTMLMGNVCLQGSYISGTLKNKTFEASWLCYRDGRHDDAAAINNLLAKFNDIHFQKGTYLLQSFHKSRYHVNKPYHLGIYRSDISLTADEGAVIETATKAGTLNIYSKPYDKAHTIRNIAIKGLTFKVVNESTDWDSYQEHCHTISMMGVRNINISDCKFDNFWGDAVCTNHYSDNPKTGERAVNDSVFVKNCYFDGYKCCNRNGVSVINGKYIWVTGNTFVNCSKRNMPGAIDVEPNYNFYTCSNIYIENNKIENCQGANGAISLVSGKKGGLIKNVVIRNNRIYNSSRGLLLYVGLVGYLENIDICDNYFDDATDPFVFRGSGEVKNCDFSRNTFLRKVKVNFGGDIRFTNLKQEGNEYSYCLPVLYFNRICARIQEFLCNLFG